MINVNCYICKSNKKKLLLKQTGKDTYLDLIHRKKGNIFNKWYSCLDCGFVFRSPVLRENEIKRMYEQNMKIINSRSVISNNKRSFFQLLVKNI